jgi:hypothetical protein
MTDSAVNSLHYVNKHAHERGESIKIHVQRHPDDLLHK